MDAPKGLSRGRGYQGVTTEQPQCNQEETSEKSWGNLEATSRQGSLGVPVICTYCHTLRNQWDWKHSSLDFILKIFHLIYNSIFQCKQLNTVMTIGFTYTKEKKINHFRNITVPVGCSCVMKQSTRIEGFLKHFIEK